MIIIFLVILGAILMALWFRAAKVDFTKYPQEVLEQAKHLHMTRIARYRQFAGGWMVMLLLNVGYHLLAGWYVNTNSKTALFLAYIAIGVLLVYLILYIVFMVYHLLKLRRQEKALFSSLVA